MSTRVVIPFLNTPVNLVCIPTTNTRICDADTRATSLGDTGMSSPRIHLLNTKIETRRSDDADTNVVVVTTRIRVYHNRGYNAYPTNGYKKGRVG